MLEYNNLKARVEECITEYRQRLKGTKGLFRKAQKSHHRDDQVKDLENIITKIESPHYHFSDEQNAQILTGAVLRVYEHILEEQFGKGSALGKKLKVSVIDSQQELLNPNEKKACLYADSNFRAVVQGLEYAYEPAILTFNNPQQTVTELIAELIAQGLRDKQAAEESPNETYKPLHHVMNTRGLHIKGTPQADLKDAEDQLRGLCNNEPIYNFILDHVLQGNGKLNPINLIPIIFEKFGLYPAVYGLDPFMQDSNAINITKENDAIYIQSVSVSTALIPSDTDMIHAYNEAASNAEVQNKPLAFRGLISSKRMVLKMSFRAKLTPYHDTLRVEMINNDIKVYDKRLKKVMKKNNPEAFSELEAVTRRSSLSSMDPPKM